jgi:hypothetical protein
MRVLPSYLPNPRRLGFHNAPIPVGEGPWERMSAQVREDWPPQRLFRLGPVCAHVFFIRQTKHISNVEHSFQNPAPRIDITTLYLYPRKHLSTVVYNFGPILVWIRKPFKRLQWLIQVIEILITYKVFKSGALLRIRNNLLELKKLSTRLPHELSTGPWTGLTAKMMEIVDYKRNIGCPCDSVRSGFVVLTVRDSQTRSRPRANFGFLPKPASDDVPRFYWPVLCLFR